MIIKYVQPREIGSKKGKSLIVHIPANMAKEYQINPSTLFLIKIDPEKGDLIFQKVNASFESRSIPMRDNSSFQDPSSSSELGRCPEFEITEN